MMDKATNGRYGFYSDAATNQLLGTALIESDLTNRMQFNGGPGRGLFQMDEVTYNDIWRTISTDRRYTGIQTALAQFTPAGSSLNFGLLVTEDDYAIAMARLKYYFALGKTAIPTSIADQAAAWKIYYNGNSPSGKTVDDYINKWNQTTGGIYDPPPPSTQPQPSNPSPNRPSSGGGVIER